MHNKILIVDDNPDNLKVLGNLLRNEGYTIGFATDGKQALQILSQADNYDLVLLDIEMPVMGGYETCKTMRQTPKLMDVPVIFLTAYNDPESIVNGFETGAQDYVTKPFNTKELLARINTHLQLKQKTQEVKEYAEELKKINATKDKFMSIIAHDLRNPFYGLQVVSGSLLKNFEDYDNEKKLDLITSIFNSSKLGSALLENLLEWSRSQVGAINFNPAEIIIYEIAENCIKSISSFSDNKHIAITNNIPAEMRINADKYMLETVLRNLLTNAIKYTPQSGTVFLSIKENKEQVEFTVKDNGIGISNEVHSKLFMLDKNSSMPGTEEEKGTGLGLILCKEFIEKHGGTIWAEKNIEKGSEFKFTIPKKII